MDWKTDGLKVPKERANSLHTVAFSKGMNVDNDLGRIWKDAVISHTRRM